MNESGFYSTTLESHAAPEPQATTFPWPPAAGTSAVGAFLRTWVDSVFRPGEFFSRMPATGGTGAAVLYYFIIGMIGAVFQLFWQLTFTVALGTIAFFSDFYELFGITAFDAFSPILEFLFAPLVLGLMLVFNFAVVHVCLLILGGARHGAGTTMRVLCYAFSPQVFVVVPFLGAVVGAIWTVVATIIGLAKAHRTETWRAVAAVFLPLLVIAVIGVMLFLLLAVALGLGMS